jgi:outer membrane lipoprotein SlyB
MDFSQPFPKKRFNTALALLALVSLVGCASQTQTGNAYSAGQARQAQTVQRGKVISVKEIEIAAHPSGVGTLAGGALGGLAGSNNGRSGSNQSAASSIVGMVMGGVAGNMLDKKVNTLKGQEISVLLNNGTEIAIAQEIDEKEGSFLVGEQVRVLSNVHGTSRVSR